MSGFYSRAAMRQAREQRASRAAEPKRAPSLLDSVPPDAPYDNPNAVMHVWTGEKFIAYDKWLATAAIIAAEEPNDEKSAIPSDADCLAGECGGNRVWLVKDGERWLMFVGSRKAAGRRRDFATPFIGHAIRTAEQWYGAPADGWRAERRGDGTKGKAADLSRQDSTAKEGTGEGRHDDLDLDWQ